MNQTALRFTWYVSYNTRLNYLCTYFMHLQEHYVYVWLHHTRIYLSNMNKQHKYEFGIKFSFIIVMAVKCQPGHNLHPINISISIISPLISLKHWVKVKQKHYFPISLFIFIGALWKQRVVKREALIPTGSEGEEEEKEGYRFFYLFEKELCRLLSQ